MKRLERSNGLDTALYKNIPLPFMIAFSEIHISGIYVKSHRFLVTTCFSLTSKPSI